jgi:hypothetical protein
MSHMGSVANASGRTQLHEEVAKSLAMLAGKSGGHPLKARKLPIRRSRSG